MRNLFFALFAFFLTTSVAFAQNGEDALKAATKAYTSFTVNQDQMKLQEAADNIEVALQDAALKDNAKAYQAAGEIYSSVISTYVNDRVLNGDGVKKMVEKPATKAAQAYMMAYKLSDKKRGKKEALEGLQALQANLTNEGIYAIQDGMYDQSYEDFNTSVEVHNFIKQEGEASAFDEDPTKLQDEKYYAALSALQTENNAEAKRMLTALYDEEYDDANVYDGLYKVSLAEGDKDAAARYLSEGREKYPDATNLLFTEINFYLQEGRLDELTDKLATAIEKEPNNVSLYTTAGSVYERLSKMAEESGDADKAGQYFDKAKTNYENGLKVDDSNASAIYSLGALYYNRAAAMTQQLVELGDDYSKEGQKKYEALKAQTDAEFQKALPYFKQAEMTDPNDANTLIALKEMYARMDEYEISNEFKERYEKVQAGGKNDGSYFEANGGE